jgi:hypothetical protein
MTRCLTSSLLCPQDYATAATIIAEGLLPVWRIYPTAILEQVLRVLRVACGGHALYDAPTVAAQQAAAAGAAAEGKCPSAAEFRGQTVLLLRLMLRGERYNGPARMAVAHALVSHLLTPSDDSSGGGVAGMTALGAAEEALTTARGLATSDPLLKGNPAAHALHGIAAWAVYQIRIRRQRGGGGGGGEGGAATTTASANSDSESSAKENHASSAAKRGRGQSASSSSSSMLSEGPAPAPASATAAAAQDEDMEEDDFQSSFLGSAIQYISQTQADEAVAKNEEAEPTSAAADARPPPVDVRLLLEECITACGAAVQGGCHELEVVLTLARALDAADSDGSSAPHRALALCVRYVQWGVRLAAHHGWEDRARAAAEAAARGVSDSEAEAEAESDKEKEARPAAKSKKRPRPASTDASPAPAPAPSPAPAQESAGSAEEAVSPLDTLFQPPAVLAPGTVLAQMWLDIARLFGPPDAATSPPACDVVLSSVQSGVIGPACAEALHHAISLYCRLVASGALDSAAAAAVATGAEHSVPCRRVRNRVFKLCHKAGSDPSKDTRTLAWPKLVKKVLALIAAQAPCEACGGHTGPSYLQLAALLMMAVCADPVDLVSRARLGAIAAKVKP